MKQLLKAIRLSVFNILIFLLLCLLTEVGFRVKCLANGSGFFRSSGFVSPWFTTYDQPLPWETDELHGIFRHRGSPVPKLKEQNTFRIIAVGGSTTANERPWATGGVDYPSSLKQVLNATSTGVVYQVLNAGSDGYSTAHSLVNIALRLIEYQPDMIILMHNINDSSVIGFRNGPTPDYSNKYLLPVYLNPRLQAGLSLEGFLYQSRLLCRLGLPQKIAEKTRILSFDNSPENGLRIFRRNLRTIAAICDAHGIRLLLLTQPHQNLEHKYVSLRIIDQYNRAIIQEAQLTGVPYFDMAAKFGDRPEHFCDMFHYSPEGITRFAKLLKPIIREIITTTQ
ncbi:MAG: SGNH/GDSL hydrolase family protein [Deltaproteobacteria bacterium]|nr:SGNH/GDSL hydrolase family protein [Deltaproteobacteria bacterium]